ncbi:MAG: immune inhibitor A [Methanomassiliicoccales archaeon]|nr:immune inhibitor A [Methanomassiliicoccales archaeon]
MMNRLQKILAMVIALTMISGAFFVMVPSAGQSAEVDASAIPEQIAVCADPELRERTVTDLAGPKLELTTSDTDVALVDNIPVNTTMPFITTGTFWNETGAPFTDVANATWYDAYNVINITKRGEGEHCELWVADNCSFYSALDPRNSLVDIQDWQVAYMIDQFDNNIYPIETKTFIDAPALNGSSPDMATWQYLYDDNNLTQSNISDMLFPTNDTGKVMIVVFNMIDENWYDATDYNAYTAGYYWSFIRTLYDRNVMHIDCYDWIDRIGNNVTRPYVYESTFAHEYQHLLHDQQDPDEATWVNEGLSMAAEFLCGYGLDMIDIAYYLNWPDNSLTVWGDMPGSLILGDYGAVLLFMTYLYDHYGGTPMLQAIFFSDLNGVDGINAALLDMGNNRMTFDRVFHDWRIANLLFDDSIGGGLYDYKSFSPTDIAYGIRHAWYPTISANWDPVYHSDFGTLQYIQAYGTDYIKFNDLGYYDEFGKFTFDGDNNVHAGWQYGAYWNSNNGDQIDNLLTLEVNLSAPAENGEYLHWLTINTQWNIENEWDYGFVQVSTDGGATWTSLDDVEDYCTNSSNPSAMESITANLPGLTGDSPGWVDLNFDLSAYDGQDILIGFRYMTDWGTSYDGWDIAAVSVDGVDVALTNLTTEAPPEADFLVTLVAHNAVDGWMIIDIPCLDLQETAQKLFPVDGYDQLYVIVSANNGPVDYSADVTYRGPGFL